MTISSSAGTVLTDHIGTLITYSLVSSASGMASGNLLEGLSFHPGCYSAYPGRPVVPMQQQLLRGSLEGCSNSPSEDQLSNLVNCFTVKPAGIWPSTLLHISPLNQTSPMSHLCREWLGSSWTCQGMSD